MKDTKIRELCREASDKAEERLDEKALLYGQGDVGIFDQFDSIDCIEEAAFAAVYTRIVRLKSMILSGDPIARKVIVKEILDAINQLRMLYVIEVSETWETAKYDIEMCRKAVKIQEIEEVN